MADPNLLSSLLYFLLAATIAVPLFVRLRLGAILGYLFAGFVIGPEALGLISDPQSVLHFSEFGVILLLFIIGLELKPEKLWSMRGQIIFLGGGQLTLCSLTIGFFLYYVLEYSLPATVVLSLALGLSSTAFAIQLMSDKGILASDEGRRGFSILLMQDLAVIPILFIVQIYSGNPDQEVVTLHWYASLAVIALLMTGRYLLDPLLKLSARYGSRETMSAAALLIVVAAAFSMAQVGLSSGLGALVAGIMLANSSYRHEIETNIEPFKGLTLGLFFIAIGMTLDIDVFIQQPFLLLSLAIGLMLLKMLIIGILVRISGGNWRNGLHLGAVLAQGGEFGFVIMAQSVSHNIISDTTAAAVNFVVTASMAMTALLVSLVERVMDRSPKITVDNPTKQFSTQPEVMILGFGRFGQIAGRILAAKSIPFTALDKDPEHIQFIRQFGNKVFYGDASRLDLLQFAGIDHARVVLVAMDETKTVSKIVSLITEHYPDIKLIARAHNRPHYQELTRQGVDTAIREVFSASLEAATTMLIHLGYSLSEALKNVELFRQHDEKLLQRAVEHYDLEKIIAFGKQARTELETLFNEDKGEKPALVKEQEAIQE